MEKLHKHVLSDFDTALQHLREDVFMMSGLTERNLANAMKGLVERDDSLCNSVIAEDDSIDQLEKQVDKDGIGILTRFQPVASDLRQVVSAMKISSNLERIADQAVSIARRARKLNLEAALPEVAIIRPMFMLAHEMFGDSMKSFADADLKRAIALKRRDKELDQLNAEAARHLTEQMAQNPQKIPGYLNLMLVARHLERVGDHATNIAEDAVYTFAAEDVRHLHDK